jgi:RHS repeat-associated protein
MNGRSWSNENYRFGFNGKEKDNETFEGCYAFEYRISDTRLGRFLSQDPLSGKYPFNSPYLFAGNRPISSIDFLGLEEAPSTKGTQGVVTAGMGLAQFVETYGVKGKTTFEKLDNLMVNNLKSFPNYPVKGSQEAKMNYINNASKKLNVDQALNLPVGSKLEQTWTLSNGELVWKPLEARNGKGKVVQNKPAVVNHASYAKTPSFLDKCKAFDEGLESHYDGANSGNGGDAGIVQVGGTIMGFKGGLYFGMSRNDGFNIGLYGGGELSLTKYGVNATFQGASGEFTWDAYKQYGTDFNLGYGSMAYGQSRALDIYNLSKKSPFVLHGLSIGIGTNWSKNTKNANISSGATYTIPFLK